MSGDLSHNPPTEPGHGRDAHATTRLVEVRQHVLKHNDLIARQLRERFRVAGVFVVSLVSSPGSGKTAFLCRKAWRPKRFSSCHPWPCNLGYYQWVAD